MANVALLTMKNFQFRRAIPSIALLLFLGAVQPSIAKTPDLEITANFPGGNIKVDSIVGTTVYLRPDIRDTTREWFYWYFAARSSRTTVVKFVFNRPNCVSRIGPAVSTDKGKNWEWLQKAPQNQNEFEYKVSAGKETRFSVAMPYLETNLKTFLKTYKKNKSLKSEVLCTTKKGRPIEKLVLSEGVVTQKPTILFTARHHACEMMANYVMEGMISTLLTKDSAMQRLLRDAQFVFVPFMDKDGVEDGDQGKDRYPHDHNRDYGNTSIHESPRALREQFPTNLLAAIDLHCPMLRGRDNETVYFITPNKNPLKDQHYRYFKELIEQGKGTLIPSLEDLHMASGEYPNGTPFLGWATKIPGIQFASTLEVPYAVHKGTAVTPENLRLLGKDMMFALSRLLAR
jgi:hypothetical protein